MHGNADRQVIAEHLGALMLAHYGSDFSDEVLSSDEEIATHAAHEFGDVVFHQGDIYPCSAGSVPVLAAALDHVVAPVRAKFIHLIGAIATPLVVTGGEHGEVARAVSSALEQWPLLVDRLGDSDEGVRLAALITLTDLARISLPGLSFPNPEPPYVAPLRAGIVGGGLRERLEDVIARRRTDFDEYWQANCDHALALLGTAKLRAEGVAGLTRDWSMLDRDRA